MKFKFNYSKLFLIFVFAVVFVGIAILISPYQEVWVYIPHLDKLFHFGGGVIAAWFIGNLIQKSNKSKFKTFALIILYVLVVGLVWEIAEYISSIYGPVYWPNWVKYFFGGGLIDSIGDLIADIVGASVFTLIRLLLS